MDVDEDAALGRCERTEVRKVAVAARLYANARHRQARKIRRHVERSAAIEALGAPAKLVDHAQRASSDEVRHAERAFALAARYGSIPSSASLVDLRAHGILPRPDRHDLAVQVLESVIASGSGDAHAIASSQSLAGMPRLTHRGTRRERLACGKDWTIAAPRPLARVVLSARHDALLERPPLFLLSSS